MASLLLNVFCAGICEYIKVIKKSASLKVSITQSTVCSPAHEQMLVVALEHACCDPHSPNLPIFGLHAAPRPSPLRAPAWWSARFTEQAPLGSGFCGSCYAHCPHLPSGLVEASGTGACRPRSKVAMVSCHWGHHSEARIQIRVSEF